MKPLYTSLNTQIPGLDKSLREPHPDYPLNQDVLDRMNCSEIARDLHDAADGKGEILEVRSVEKYGSINVFENGVIEEGMDYHQVYSDGQYIYEPRITSQAMPKGDWEKHIKGINDCQIKISDKPKGLR
ncbi:MULTISPECIES: hypothetical protein [Providencia]|uniref:Uncharacterized protein n=1 Tax=Providencia stuartii TaxID=588 RepID=A0A1S1HR74_PROST|nr:hypothetical protein A3Q29_18345 [Providencia stuartii]